MIGEIIEECGPLEPEYLNTQCCLNQNPECSFQENTPESCLKEKNYLLDLILENKPLTRLPQPFEQFHEILEDTHIAKRAQALEVKGKPKGRMAHKKAVSNSTKCLPFYQKIVEYRKKLVAE
ncbi:uncharacterized protein VP01_108g8 [Puccinia sorghi]|uniref:Uncharacterized protein n=1 Tax=Puccinia sorghi TaxID=27349 RepID=A0A0L6VT43_9BASI|nr:uncharacterized protein VP01_108g8 [Puccinia sorghi]